MTDGSGEPARGDLRGRALFVVLGCFVVQLGLGFGYVMSTLAGDLIADFGLTRTEWSGRASIQLAAQALASPLVGTLCIRFGSRGVVAGSVFLLCAVFAGFAGAGALWQVYALGGLMGVMLAGIGDVVVGGVVPQWVERSRGLALGIVYTGANVAGFAMTRLAAWMADSLDWRRAVLILGAAGLAIMLPAALGIVRDARPGEGVSARGVATGGRHERPGSDDDLDLAAALRTRSFWVLGFALFCFLSLFLAMFDHFVLFLTDEGFERSEAARYFGWAILMGLGSKIGFGWIADHVPHKAALLVNQALFAASPLAALFIPSPLALGLFIGIYGFSSAARDVIYPLVVADCFGVRYLAQIYGALSIALWPGGTLGPLFAGRVRDLTGSYDGALVAFALLNVVALLSMTLIRREGRSAS